MRSAIYWVYKKSKILPALRWWSKDAFDKVSALFNGRKFDKAFSIDTTEAFDKTELDVSNEQKAHASSYHACDVERFRRAMGSFKMDYKTACFIDIGSGKGRVVLMAEELGFQQVVGVEFSKKLHEIAQRNLEIVQSKVGRKMSAQLLNCDALQYSFPTIPSVVFLFNPFDDVIMGKFVSNLEKSVEITPRDVFVVYVHPCQNKIFAQSSRWIKVCEDRAKDDFIVYKAKI